MQMLWEETPMAYLACPSCGTTFFDRNPLAPRDHCPRCVARRGVRVELERVSPATGGAAASVLGAMPAVDPDSAVDGARPTDAA